jgi:type I restriction enzyme, R subunit
MSLDLFCSLHDASYLESAFAPRALPRLLERFHEPLLHTPSKLTKKLGGVNVVQTLSRLNRTHPAKDETMVLDFAKEGEAIHEAFESYYEPILSEGTHPNLLHDL